MTQQNQSPVVTDEMVERAARAIYADGNCACVGGYDACPVKDEEGCCRSAARAALKAALPSGVRVTDDLADKLCQAITHSGALMYQEEIVAVQDVIRKTLSAIEPAPSPSHAETVAPYAAAPAPDELEVVAYGEFYSRKIASVSLRSGRHHGEPLVRLSDAQAAITALRAERERLERERDALDGECQQSMLDICRERERAETAEARVVQLKEALEFYATSENWCIGGPLDGNSGNYTGGPARATLASVRAKMEEQP